MNWLVLCITHDGCCQKCALIWAWIYFIALPFQRCGAAMRSCRWVCPGQQGNCPPSTQPSAAIQGSAPCSLWCPMDAVCCINLMGPFLSHCNPTHMNCFQIAPRSQLHRYYHSRKIGSIGALFTWLSDQSVFDQSQFWMTGKHWLLRW